MSYYFIMHYYHIAESPAHVLLVGPKFGSQLLAAKRSGTSSVSAPLLSREGWQLMVSLWSNTHHQQHPPPRILSLQWLIMHVLPHIEEPSTPRCLLLQAGNITLHFVGKMKKRDKSFSPCIMIWYWHYIVNSEKAATLRLVYLMVPSLVWC